MPRFHTHLTIVARFFLFIKRLIKNISYTFVVKLLQYYIYIKLRDEVKLFPNLKEKKTFLFPKKLLTSFLDRFRNFPTPKIKFNHYLNKLIKN